MRILMNDNTRSIFPTFSNVDLYDQGRNVLSRRLKFARRFSIRYIILMTVIGQFKTVVTDNIIISLYDVCFLAFNPFKTRDLGRQNINIFLRHI